MTNESESSVCPHCGLKIGEGYAGIPLCRQPWVGSSEAILTLPNCILQRSKGSSAGVPDNREAQVGTVTGGTLPAGPRSGCEVADMLAGHPPLVKREAGMIYLDLTGANHRIKSLERELSATRASEAMYIARARKAESELADATAKCVHAHDALNAERGRAGEVDRALDHERQINAASARNLTTLAHQLATERKALDDIMHASAQMLERTRERCKDALSELYVDASKATIEQVNSTINALQPEAPEQGGEK